VLTAQVVEFESTTGGVLLPRMDTQQRDAINEPSEGKMIYNTSTGTINYWFELEPNTNPTIIDYLSSLPNGLAILLQAGETHQSLLDAGVDLIVLYNQGVSINELLNTGLTIQQLYDGGINAQELYDGGITIQQLIDIGLSIQQLYDEGITAQQLYDEGITVQAII